ncbi:MAG: HlyD family secretion protein [Prevotellaceae bacterium]|jgi:HlyD family secretion protein|nr:HlyD family secretion protein [Prevotellaceae bacterium]
MEKENKISNSHADTSPESEVELRSEEFQEVLSRVPSWIQRWGITLILILLAILLVGSALFRYPEIVTAPIVVTTENLPQNIVAKVSGRIDTLYIAEKQKVTKNQTLGVLENTANTEDILFLEKELVAVSPDSLNAAAILRYRAFSLGELQPAFSSLQKAAEDYNFFVETDYHNKKIAVIQKQISVQKNLLNQSYKQLKITEKQLVSANKNFSTDSTLFAKNVLSAFEFENAKTVRLQTQQNLESAKSGIESQKISVLQSEQTVFDLQQQRNEQFSDLKLQYINALENLKAQIKTWEQTYLLKSQTDGNVTFTKYWQRNQNVTAGEIILSIVPTENQHIIGKIMLPPQGAGKVKTGQIVNVKFDNFPYMEYGMLKVSVKNIALVPVNQNNTRTYVLEVDFPQNLTTTYNNTLTFSQEMTGTAEIITEDLSLLERLLQPLRAMWKK